MQASFHSPSPLYTGNAEVDGDLQCKFCTRALTRVSSLEQTAVAKSFLGGVVRCNCRLLTSQRDFWESQDSLKSAATTNHWLAAEIRGDFWRSYERQVSTGRLVKMVPTIISSTSKCQPISSIYTVVQLIIRPFRLRCWHHRIAASQKRLRLLSHSSLQWGSFPEQRTATTINEFTISQIANPS